MTISLKKALDDHRRVKVELIKPLRAKIRAIQRRSKKRVRKIIQRKMQDVKLLLNIDLKFNVAGRTLVIGDYRDAVSARVTFPDSNQSEIKLSVYGRFMRPSHMVFDPDIPSEDLVKEIESNMAMVAFAVKTSSS